MSLNGRHLLKVCLDSLSQVHWPDLEIFVVDNGSQDGTADWLHREHPQVHVLPLPSNIGFARASNMALPHCQGDFVAFLNNDTKVDAEAFRFCIELLRQDPGIGLCQPKLLFMDPSVLIDSTGTYLTPFGFGWHRGHRQANQGYDSIDDIFAAKGACMVFPKDVLTEIGGFDDDFGSYFEDDDLSWRVWLSGRRVVFLPRAIVYHAVGATSEKMPWSHVQNLAYRNRISSIVVNAGPKRLATVLPVHLAICTILTLTYLLTGRIKLANSVLSAIGWNVIHLPHLLRKRRRIQSNIRKVGDEEFWRKISTGAQIRDLVSAFRAMIWVGRVEHLGQSPAVPDRHALLKDKELGKHREG